MASRRLPGKFDCYAKADADEPIFVLLGRDPLAAPLIQLWIEARARLSNDLDADEEQLCAAEVTSRMMHAWAISLGKSVSTARAAINVIRDAWTDYDRYFVKARVYGAVACHFRTALDKIYAVSKDPSVLDIVREARAWRESIQREDLNVFENSRVAHEKRKSELLRKLQRPPECFSDEMDVGRANYNIGLTVGEMRELLSVIESGSYG